MLAILLALVTSTWAAPLQQELTWDLTLEGQPLGQRTTTVKYLPVDGGMKRVLESYTELEGKLGPVPMAYQERITAHAGAEPASFFAVQETNDKPREVQAQRVAMGWKVSISEDGRTRTYDIAASRIDLSTADLFDPASRVPLSRFDEVKVLSAETGTILEGTIEPLGPTTIAVDGQDVDVQGWAFDHPEGRGEFWYTADGYLVRYDMAVLGYTVRGLLAEPPPRGMDDAPLDGDAGGIEEIEL